MSFFTTVGMIVLGCASCAVEPAAGVAGESIHVVCHGRLLQNVVAIGAHTTGTTVSFDGMTWDLKLTDEIRRQLAQDEYRHVTVSGRLHKVNGTERQYWVVEVEKLTKRDTKAPKPKAEFTLVGKLSPMRDKDLPTTIEVDGEAWPIAWGTEAGLPSQAAALAGKTVMAQGTAEANTDGGPKKYPIFHIADVKAK